MHNPLQVLGLAGPQHHGDGTFRNTVSFGQHGSFRCFPKTAWEFLKLSNTPGIFFRCFPLRTLDLSSAYNNQYTEWKFPVLFYPHSGFIDVFIHKQNFPCETFTFFNARPAKQGPIYVDYVQYLLKTLYTTYISKINVF